MNSSTNYGTNREKNKRNQTKIQVRNNWQS